MSDLTPNITDEMWDDFFNNISYETSREDAVHEKTVRPSHYKVGGLEVIDIIKATLTPEQFKGFCMGNIIKYRMRAGKKGDAAVDLKKANVYEEWL